CVTGVSRHQIPSGIDSNLAQRLRHTSEFRTIEPRLYLVDVERCRLDLAEQHDVIALPVNRIRKDHSVRECFKESRDFALHSFFVTLIQLYELCDHAPRVEMLFRDLEELARVERCRALHPWIKRVRCDAIELFLRRQ